MRYEFIDLRFDERNSSFLNSSQKKKIKNNKQGRLIFILRPLTNHY